MDNFPDRLRGVRKMMNISQKDFGERVGISHAFVSKMENGKVRPSSHLLDAIEYKWLVRRHWLETGEGGMFVDDSPPWLKRPLLPKHKYKGHYGDRLKMAMDELGITIPQIALTFGLTMRSINRFMENKEKPNVLFLVALEHHFGISRDWIFQGIGDMFIAPSVPGEKCPVIQQEKLSETESNSQDYEYIPILEEKAAAGLPGLIDNEYVSDMAIIHNQWLTKGRHVAFHVRGDSMAPLIGDGFLVAVNLNRNNPEQLLGQIVLAYLWEGITIKYLTKDRDHYMLVPENKEFAPILLDMKDVRLIGAVEWWFGRPKKR